MKRYLPLLALFCLWFVLVGAVSGIPLIPRINGARISTGTTWTLYDRQGNAGPVCTDAGTTVTCVFDAGVTIQSGGLTVSGGGAAITGDTAVTGQISATDTINAPTITQGGAAVHVAGGTDVPITDGGTGASSATAGFDALAPTTTQGDIIYHNGTDNVRLAKGTALQQLRMNSGATAPEWATTSSGSTGFLELADTVTNSTTSAANITGLSWSVVSGSTYRFACDLTAQAAANTTGIQVGIDLPASSSSINVNCVNWASGVWSLLNFTTDDGACAFTASLGAFPANYRVDGSFVAGGNGTAQMRVKSEVGTSAVDILAGSSCRLILEP